MGAEEQGKEPMRWLLFIYRVPQDPPGRRTYVWRHLKQLGAVYLQQAAAVLPHREHEHRALVALAARVRGFEGEVSLLETTSPNHQWERETVGRFNQARDDEYAEVVENVERFEDEIARESRRGKFTFAELEDVEADYEKIKAWYGRVRGRDFFGASGRTEAESALERGRRVLEGFTAAVYEREGVQGAPGEAIDPSRAEPGQDGGSRDDVASDDSGHGEEVDIQ